MPPHYPPTFPGDSGGADTPRDTCVLRAAFVFASEVLELEGFKAAVDGGAVDSEDVGDLFDLFAAGQELADVGQLFVVELTGSSSVAASCSCDLKTCSGAFDDEITFHLSEGGHGVEEEGPYGCGCVDRFGERAELNVLVFELGDEGDQVLKRASDPIELPDDEGIASSQMREGLL